VHVGAVVHRADRFALDDVQRIGQMLRVTPHGEACVLPQRTLGQCALRADGALRLDRGECGQADAGEQHEQRPPKPADADGFGE